MGVLLILAVIALAFLTGVLLSHVKRMSKQLRELGVSTDKLQYQLDALDDAVRDLTDGRSRRRSDRWTRDGDREDE